MKVTVFALLLVAVSAYALPEEYETDLVNREQRVVTNQIRRMIQELKLAIREAGWDPKEVDRIDFEHSPAPFVRIVAFIEGILFFGASNIAINQLDYSALTNRLRFNIDLPFVSFGVANSGVTASAVGNRFTGSLSGRVIVRRLGLSGDIRVNVGIISGISIRSLVVNLSHPAIQSTLSVRFQNQDISADVNNVLNVVIPNYLAANRAAIDQRLTDHFRSIADDILGNNAIVPEEITSS